MSNFDFTPEEWLNDPQVRSVSLAARGLLMDLVSLVLSRELTWFHITTTVLADILEIDQKTMDELLTELKHAGCCNFTILHEESDTKH
jgi:hypothetical protein